MGPPSYMWSVVDRNVVMQRIPVPGVYLDSLYFSKPHTRSDTDSSIPQSYAMSPDNHG